MGNPEPQRAARLLICFSLCLQYFSTLLISSCPSRIADRGSLAKMLNSGVGCQRSGWFIEESVKCYRVVLKEHGLNAVGSYIFFSTWDMKYIYGSFEKESSSDAYNLLPNDKLWIVAQVNLKLRSVNRASLKILSYKWWRNVVALRSIENICMYFLSNGRNIEHH